MVTSQSLAKKETKCLGIKLATQYRYAYTRAWTRCFCSQMGRWKTQMYCKKVNPLLFSRSFDLDYGAGDATDIEVFIFRFFSFLGGCQHQIAIAEWDRTCPTGDRLGGGLWFCVVSRLERLMVPLSHAMPCYAYIIIPRHATV